MTANRRLYFVFAVLLFVFLPVLASAATSEFRVLIDADNNAATGCTTGGMSGVDHVVVTLVRTDATSGAVNRSYRLACTGGTFGSPQDLNETGWGVGFHPASGGMSVENRIAFATVKPGGGTPVGMRLGFDGAADGNTHSVSSAADGAAIIYPRPVGRRRSAEPVGTDPRVIILDGLTADWGGLEPIAAGMADNGSRALRMIRVFAFANTNDQFVYFRIDANVSSDAPFAEDDEYQRNPGTANLNVPSPGVLGNDGDPNARPLTALPVSPASHGEVTLNPDGSFTYTPNNPVSSVTDSFHYKANNGTHDSNVAKVTIKVATGDENDPVVPNANNDQYSTSEDTPLSVPAPGLMSNDTPPAANRKAEKLTNPTFGTVIVNADGSFTYTPNPNFFGTDSFTYKLVFPAGEDQATVTITIESVNDTPVLNNTSFAVGENSPNGTVVGTVTGTDDDADTLSYAITGGNTNGAFTINAATGQITVANSGALDFESTPAFNLTIAVTDNGTPALSDTATITITLNDVNETPVAVNDSATVAEDGSLSVPAPGLLANDVDEDGDTLTATKMSDPAFGVATVAANGAWTYTPNANFNGTDSFTYRVNDGAANSNVATVTITVTAVNDTPSFTGGGNVAVDEDNAYNAPWATGISAGPADEAGQSLTFNVSNGNTALFTASGQPAISSSGVLTFTPAPDANGTANVTVTLSDNGGGANTSAPQNFTITVREVNDAPTATNDANTTAEDTVLAFPAATLTANDSAGPANESGQTLTVTAVSATSAQGGTVTLAGGNVTYTPAANFHGTDTFTYTVTDNGTTGGAADPRNAVGTVTITVNSVNDTPSFTGGGNVAVNEDTAHNAPWATSISAGPADESSQNLTFNVSNDNTGLFTAGGQPAISPSGVLTFTPLANANGTANVTVTLSDNGGGANTSAPQNFTITVREVNDAPTATNDASTTQEDTALVIAAATLTANDSAGPANESGQTLTVTGVSGTSAQGGTVTLVAGTITYTPAANYNGPDSFTYTVTDNGTTAGAADPQSATGTVTITVTEVNDAPVANADAISTPEDTSTTFPASSLTTNDSAGPANESGQTLTVTGVSGSSAQGGIVALALGNITYIPPANYNGPDSFTYTVTDNGTNNGVAAPLSAVGTVNVTVSAVNDAPALTVTGAVTHTEGGTATNLATAVNIADVDDTHIESATIQITGNFAAGQDVLSFVDTPSITGSYNAGTGTLTLTGSDTIANYAAALQAVQYTNTSNTPSTLQRAITWVVSDGSNNSNTQVTTLDVVATNDGPLNTVPGAQTVSEDTPLTFSTGNGNAISIADADAGPDDVQVTLNVANGTVTVNPAGAGALTSLTGDGTNTVVITGTVAEINAVLNGMVFTPTSQYNGPAQVQIVTDDLGNNPSGAIQDTDAVSITVNAVNDPPVLTVAGAVSHTEGGGATNLATSAGITDPDDTNIESATVQITGNFASGQDVLSFVDTPSITGSYNAGTGTLTLTGSDTKANYAAALQAVQYTNTSDTPSTLQRTITWTVNDGSDNSNSQTTTVSVTATNDGPQNTVPAGLSTGEDTPLVINGASISDADADPDDVQLTLNVGNGTVTLDATATGALTSLTGDGTNTVVATGTVAEINAALSGMTFTPSADFSGTGSIQMVTNDLGNNPSGAITATDSFNITVNAVNDAPVLTVTGSAAFTENGAPVAAATAVNLTDVDDANIESATISISNNFQAGDALVFVNTVNITGTYNTGTGLLTLTGTDTKAAYIAALQSITFSHAGEAPSEATRTITWVVNDGDTNSNSQNTTVAVTAVNDGPVHNVPGTQTTSEDTPLVLSSATFNVSDADAAADDVQSTFTITNGTLTLNPAATGALTSLTGNGTNSVVATGTVAEINAAINGASFTPATDFSGTASIQISTNDLGNNPSGAITATNSFNITVNAANDAPVLTVTGSPTFAENGPAVALASTVNITDVDDANIESATITITNVQSGDLLNFVNTVNITGTYNAGSGVLSLTGTDSKAAYISALQSITFSNGSDNPSTTQRTLTWVVSDGDTNSNTQNTTVGVTATNDGPSNTVPAGLSTGEDTPLVINGASIADPDADPDDVQITLNVGNGSVTLDPTATGALASLTGDGTGTVVATGTVAEINAALSGMTFTPANNFNGTASIQMVTNDLGNNPSGAITATDSFNITVNAVNDPPSFTPGNHVSISEDHGVYSESNWATNISAGPADENSQGLSMQSTVTGTTGSLTFAQGPLVNVVNGNLSFQANANTCGTATINVVLTDDAGTPGNPGDDLNSPTHVLNITVQCVNDAPSFTKGPDQTVNEDAGAQTVNPWATGISPGPGESDALTFNVSNDNNALFTAGGQPAVSATGVLTYTPAPNANGVATVSVTLTDDGGTPGDSSDDITTTPAQTFTITVNALNDAPSFSIAGDPPFVVLGAGAQTVNAFATSITDGDPEVTQVLTFNLSQTANSGTLSFSAGPAIDPATGNLTYTPAAGTHGTVTYSVTLSDDGATGGSNVNVSGAQSFTIAVEKAPEVTTTVPADNATGVSTSTNITVNFDEPVSVTLSPASFKINCNAGADLAFTYVGGTTNVTSVTLDPTNPLPAGNCVVTVVAAEVHDADAFDPPDGLAADFTFDFVTNTPPTATDDNATALGHVTLTVSDAAGVLSNDTDPDAGSDMDVQNFGTPITTSQGGTITFNKEGGYTYNSQAGDQNVTDTVNYTVTDQFGGTDTGTLTINLGQRFIYVDDDHPTATPDGRDIHPYKTMQQAQAGSAPGDTILVKSGSYTDHIVLQASQNLIGQGIGASHTHTHNSVVFTVLTPGAAPSISRAAAGDTVTLSTNNTIRGVAIGSSNGKGIVGNNFTAVTINDNVTVSANGNAALHLDTGAVTATLNNVSASSGANSALIFNALTGTLDINAGTISNTAGATLNLTGGSLAGTIAANLSTSGSSLVNVASRTANALTLSGALSGSGTIAASGNAAGTTLTFSGTQSLNTGAVTGVNLANNPGTISFTGGALQISTTNGAGFIASGATGNVNVTGANNTISTLSGIPLQMTGGVDIGASGVTFRSISANGAANGIVLADTGANAFTLAGTGTAGTGGTLQSITGAAVSLTNTNNVALNHLTVSGAGTGISGSSFGTLTLRDLAVSAVTGLNLTTGTVNNAPAANAFTSLSSTGGTNGVALTGVGGGFNVAGGTLSGASGSTFLVNGGTVTASWAGNMSQANAGAVVDIQNAHNGAITFSGNVTATNGTGLQFNNADGNYQFTGAAALSGGAGIDVLAGSGGTFNWDGDSSIGNSTGELINIQASAPAFTYSGTLSKANTGRGIFLLNNTGGTFTIDGTGTKSIHVNAGASHAIELDNNDNMTMTFSNNNLVVQSTTGDAFRAVNGGTVTVAGAGNTAQSAGGAGVNIANTFIGASGVTFRSVTTNGGTSGVIINNTGTTAGTHGGFTISGTGSAGSGGTMQNHSVALNANTMRGLSLSSINFTNGNTLDGGGAGACDSGTVTGCNGVVKMTAVTNATLTQLTMGGTIVENGIFGNNVRNLDLSNVTITNAGDGVNEHGIRVSDLFGTNAAGQSNLWSNLNITNSAGHNIFVQTNSATNAFPGSKDELTITNSVFANPGSAGQSDQITVAGRNAANIRTSLTNNTFNSTRVCTDAMQVDAGNTTNSDVIMTGNTFNVSYTIGTTVVQGCNTAMNVSGADSSVTTFNVSNNPVVLAGVGNAINIASNGAATLSGTVSGHTGITVPAGLKDGISNGTNLENNGMGIDMVVDQQGTITANVDGNTVTDMAGGIRGGARNTGTGRFNLTLSNNNLDTGGAFPFYPVWIFSGNGSTPTESNEVCVNFNNNQTSSSMGLQDYWLEQFGSNNKFNIQGLSPATGATEAQVEAYVSSKDIGGAVVEAFGGTTVVYTGSGVCSTP